MSNWAIALSNTTMRSSKLVKQKLANSVIGLDLNLFNNKTNGICFFRMYLTTKLARPHYPAEVSAKVAILDFRVTSAGMESYLLGVTVSRDRPDVEAEKNQLLTMKMDTKRYKIAHFPAKNRESLRFFFSMIHFSRTLMNEENKILDTLFSDDNLLENDASVQLISSSKIQINELLEKISVAKVTEKQIDVTRTAYKPLAAHAAIIYFTIGNT